MPQVPTVDTFQVIPQARAKGVEFVNTPYQDDAWKKLAPIAAGLGDLATKLQDRQDEAIVTDKVVNYKRFLIDQTYGDNGYTKLKEGNALKPDDEGRSLAQRYEAANTDYARSLMQDMNERQQLKFRQQIMPLDNGFHQSALSYTLGESDRYNEQVFQGYLQTQQSLGAQYAQDSALVMQALRDGTDKIDEHAKEYGWGSEAVNAAKTSFSANLLGGAMGQLLTLGQSNPRYTAQARALLNTQKSKFDAASIVRYSALLEDQENEHRNAAMVQQWIDGSMMAQTAVGPRAVRAVRSVMGTGTGNAAGVSPETAAAVVNGDIKGTAGASSPTGGQAASETAQDKATVPQVSPQQRNAVAAIGGLLDTSTALGVYEAVQRQVGKTLTADEKAGFQTQYRSNQGLQDVVEGAYLGGLVKKYGNTEQALTARLLGMSAVDQAIQYANRDGQPDKWRDYLSPAQQKALPKVQQAIDAFNQIPSFVDAQGNKLEPTSVDAIIASYGLPQEPTLAQARAAVLRGNPNLRYNAGKMLSLMNSYKMVAAEAIAQRREQIMAQTNEIMAEVQAAGGKIKRLSSKSQMILYGNPTLKRAAESYGARLQFGGETDLTAFVRLTNPDYLKRISENQLNVELANITNEKSFVDKARAAWCAAHGDLRKAQQILSQGDVPDAVGKAVTPSKIESFLTDQGVIKPGMDKNDARALALGLQNGFAHWLTNNGYTDPSALTDDGLRNHFREYQASVATFGGTYRGKVGQPLLVTPWKQVRNDSSKMSTDIVALVKAIDGQNLKPGEIQSDVSLGRTYEQLKNFKSPNLLINLSAGKANGFAFSRPYLNTLAQKLSDPRVGIIPQGATGADLAAGKYLTPQELAHYYLLGLMDDSVFSAAWQQQIDEDNARTEWESRGLWTGTD